MTERRLIVNADDYGLTAGVDRGIEIAVAAGAVTSVSVMAGFARPGAVAALAARHPALSIGVHVNLTTGRPILSARAVPSLVDDAGRFMALDALTRRALRGRIAAGEVRAEVTAQIAAVASAGVRLDHVDSHEHVHLLPGVTGAVLAAALGAGIRGMRTHRPRLLGAGGIAAVAAYYRRHPRRIATHAVKHALAARLRLAGMRTPDGMVGGALLLTSVAGGPAAEWSAVCAALPPGTWELVVHPAEVGPGDDRALLGELVARRRDELAALSSPEFRTMIRTHGVVLASFAALDDGTTAAAPARQEDGYVARRA